MRIPPSLIVVAGLTCAGVIHPLAAADAPGGTPWPAPVAGWKAPESGEHPRLFFRASDLPELRRRAETPDGKAIVQALRVLLDGKEGRTLPEIVLTAGQKPPEPKNLRPGMVLGLFHPAGYGMLHLLTGEQLYADLGKQAMERILTNMIDLDARYGFVNPNGALRAGPSLGAVAMGYDLCYQGWDDAFRTQVAEALQKGPNGFALDYLVQGRRHGPHSNHWGPQIGGGALAILALWKDPGVDNARIEALMEDSKKVVIRQLTEGFGDGGMFWESKGPGGIGSDTAFIPAIQAWRVAGGQDFVSPQPHAAAITMIKVHELLKIQGDPWYLVPGASGYGSGLFAPVSRPGLTSDRGGISRGGQFCQGFGAIPDQLKPAALWVYNRIVEPDPANRTYDTLPYDRYFGLPHRAVLALVNWPIGVTEVNPAELIPKVHWDDRLGYYAFRNQWTGTEEDLVVNVVCRARDPHGFMIWGMGERRTFGPCPHKAQTTHFQPAEDGSGTLTVGPMSLGVDFSKASGADALIVTVGMPMTGAQQIEAGGQTFHVLLLGGKPDKASVQGDLITVGGQQIRYDGQKIILAKMAGPPKLKRLGLW